MGQFKPAEKSLLTFFPCQAGSLPIIYRQMVVPLRKGQRKIANHWMSMAAKHPKMDHYSLPFMK
jgi:hypothetical protein